MQLYQSHKQVRAFKIANILNRRTVAPVLKGESDEVTVDSNYMRKHNPLVGGYYVLYKSGYESWSPADEFEEGNSPIEEEEDGNGPAQEDNGLSGLESGGDSSDESSETPSESSGGGSKDSPG